MQRSFKRILAALTAVFAIICLALFFSRGGSGIFPEFTAAQDKIYVGNDSGPIYETVPGDIININTADSEELQKLNGVGAVIAERIIAYRNENGAFDNIEELKNVPGIGEENFEKMREFIVTENTE